MKIALFTDTFTPQVNGVANTLDRFTQYLRRNGIEYYVFAPENTREDSFVVNVKKIRSISLSIYPECRLAIPNLASIRKELQRLKPDLIHVATPFNMGLCGLYYAKKLNIPLVGSYHTDFDAYLQYYKMNFLSSALWNYLRWFHSTLRKTFVPSPETLKQLKKNGFRNLHIWGRGVECSMYHPHYETETVRRTYNIQAEYILSYVGRMAPEKDIATLLEIIKKTKQKLGDAVHWLLVGDGPLADEMKEQLGENVTFTGYLKGDALAAVYAASHLMVFPSATETFGNVVLEALASGTPVLGANAGGVKNIIQHGKTGYLYKPKQTNDFYTGIEELLYDETKRMFMSHSAREYALSQSWDNIFENLLNEYEDVIRTHHNELLA